MGDILIDMKVDWDKALRDVDRLVKQVVRANQGALEKVAAEVIEEAKTIVPVRTGRLKNSLAVLTSKEGVVTVGSPLGYAGYVEKGTSRMKAEPYLWPAIRETMDKYPETLAVLLYRGD